MGPNSASNERPDRTLRSIAFLICWCYETTTWREQGCIEQ